MSGQRIAEAPRPNSIARRWGTAIRLQRMKVKKISVADLAEAVGVSRASVYDWEAGRTTPHPEKHVAIAEALGIHPQNLFTYPEVQG